MFSFNSQKKLVELQKYVRRLCDRTTAELSPLEGESRSDSRHYRVIPTILSPWEDDGPVLHESAFVLTKDVSERGVGLVLEQPFRAERVVLGFWLPHEDHPDFFLGDIRQNSPIGGGFWVIGIELVDVATPAETKALQRLLPMAEKLLPAKRPVEFVV
jgi:hypothetical protein